jgi:DNA-binding NarL/FixJ family response regulator
MDLNPTSRDRIEATREIVTAATHNAVPVLTIHEDDEPVFSAVHAGKDAPIIGRSGRRRGSRR